MNTDLMDSTRRYGRSTSEVFADERAEWFEGPVKSARADKAVFVTVALGYFFVMATLAWELWK